MNRFHKLFSAVTAVAIAGLISSAGASGNNVFSGGIASGITFSQNDELKEDVGDLFSKISIVSSWEFRKNIALFADINWFIPFESSSHLTGKNLSHFGGDVGIDYFFRQHGLRPFIGVGFGMHYIDREFRGLKDYILVDPILPPPPLELADKFGLSLTGHVGVAFEVSETAIIRLRVPVHTVFNNYYDGVLGVDLSVMLTNKWRGTKK